ncbi:MAG: hypothetical protein ACRDQ7_10200 [Haloechinothrix sp.]
MNRKKNVRSALVGGAAVAQTLTLLPSSAVAEQFLGQQASECSEDPMAQRSRVTDAQTLSTPVVTSGKVYRAGKRPVAGAPVRLMAWPKLEMLDTLKDSDEIKLKAIGRTRTAKDGSYVMRADPMVNLDEFTSENGSIDVTLYADTADGGSAYPATVLRADVSGERVASANVEGDSTEGTMPNRLDLELESAPQASADAQSVSGKHSGMSLNCVLTA